jgi:hypothetical protein
MKRKAHVWTAIVDRVYLVAVSEQAERMPVDVNDEPAHIPQLCKRSGTGKTSRGNSSHVLLLHQKT